MDTNSGLHQQNGHTRCQRPALEPVSDTVVVARLHGIAHKTPPLPGAKPILQAHHETPTAAVTELPAWLAIFLCECAISCRVILPHQAVGPAALLVALAGFAAFVPDCCAAVPPAPAAAAPAGSAAGAVAAAAVAGAAGTTLQFTAATCTAAVKVGRSSAGMLSLIAFQRLWHCSNSNRARAQHKMVGGKVGCC